MPIRKSGLNYVTEVINSRCGMEVWLWPSLLFPCVLSHSVVSDSATSWIASCQAPPSMGFSRQEYWSELPCPSPGNPPNIGIESRSPRLQEDFYHLSHQRRPNVSLPNGLNKLPTDNMRRQIRIYIKDKN